MQRNILTKSLVGGALSLGLFFFGTQAWAHHSVAAKFDTTKSTEMTGIVTELDWRNPQAHIFINVKDPKTGVLKNWAVEIEAPSILEMDGWNRDTLRPGDKIIVKGPTARDNTRQIWGDSVRFASTGLPVFTAKLELSKRPLAARPAPRWPDGHPALGAIPGGADGYWTDPSKTALVEDGVNVTMDKYGQLANVAADAAKVAPMQPWALELYKNRQNRNLRDDPMFINCKPPGGTRQYQSRLGVQFMEDTAHKRIFVLLGSGNHNYHIIYLDGRKQVGLQGGDDDNPLYYGRSVAKWEGDTLVVDTKDFNEDFWFTEGGLPHSDQLHLIERFTRADFDTLKYEVQIDDPGAYTRTWKAGWTLKWNGSGTLPSFFCQSNRQ